ncbi:hypothetical protein CR512_02655 [Pseudomonas putida]|nr:hypothetical protein CR512_02655 [Pseudomonas putida]
MAYVQINDQVAAQYRYNSLGQRVAKITSQGFTTYLYGLNQDPQGSGQQTLLNLCFPGQYYDAESGLHYNYFRGHDPQTWRYVESDPIGLSGGLNTNGILSEAK